MTERQWKAGDRVDVVFNNTTRRMTLIRPDELQPQPFNGTNGTGVWVAQPDDCAKKEEWPICWMQPISAVDRLGEVFD